MWGNPTPTSLQVKSKDATSSLGQANIATSIGLVQARAVATASCVGTYLRMTPITLPLLRSLECCSLKGPRFECPANDATFNIGLSHVQHGCNSSTRPHNIREGARAQRSPEGLRLRPQVRPNRSPFTISPSERDLILTLLDSPSIGHSISIAILLPYCLVLTTHKIEEVGSPLREAP